MPVVTGEFGLLVGLQLSEMLRPLVRPRTPVTVTAKATRVEAQIAVEVTSPNASEGPGCGQADRGLNSGTITAFPFAVR
jgi:hypothetical protein